MRVSAGETRGWRWGAGGVRVRVRVRVRVCHAPAQRLGRHSPLLLATTLTAALAAASLGVGRLLTLGGRG